MTTSNLDTVEKQGQTVEKQGQVVAQLEISEKLIGDLGDIVNCLDNKLQNISTIPTPSPTTDEKAKDPSVLCDIAEKVRTGNRNLGIYLSQLKDIKDRLEN